jgi:hypothetical protein
MKQKALIGKKPETTHYSIADHIGFHSRGVELCGKYGQLIDSPELINRYHQAVAWESDAFNPARQSEYTDRKADVDRRRDKVYRGMRGLVRIQLKHFEPSIRAAASHVDTLLKSYGDVPRANYSAKTADIDSLVDRLHGDAYRLAAETLGLRSWINELEALNLRFKTLEENAAQEAMAKPKVSARLIRNASDDALRRIIARIEARIILDGPEPFAAFAREYNILVKEYNTHVHEHYGRLHARTDIAPAIIGSIDAQPYTGKPVIVIPTVSLRHQGSGNSNDNRNLHCS